MKKAFLGLILMIALLLTGTALAEDLVCRQCGQSDYTLFPSNTEVDGVLTNIHFFRCTHCNRIMNEYGYGLCTPQPGTDNCLQPETCSECGTPMWYSASADPTKHTLSEWLWYNDELHFRYCANGCSQIEEFEAHADSEANCMAPAFCSVCNDTYGNLGDHVFTDWTPADDELHTRACTIEGCGLVQSTGHHFGEWAYATDEQHVRTCADCGFEDFGDHFGGTADCKWRAECTVCGELYGEVNPNNHRWNGVWLRKTVNDEPYHYRTCSWNTDHIEEAPCFGGEIICGEQRICEVCEKVYGPRIDHDFADAVYLDEEYHTFTCSRDNCPEKVVSYEHDWSDWADNGDGTHSRACRTEGCGAAQTADHTGDGWSYLNGNHHHYICVDCGAQILGEHTGGTATCAKQAVCDDCASPYGTLNVAAHPNPVTETKPATCHTEGYIRITCDEPGCGEPLLEFILPTNGQHIYRQWTPVGDGSHIGACSFCDDAPIVPCTVFTAELFAACPICGEYDGGVLPLLIAREDEALPVGALIVRGMEAPVDGVLYVLTIAGSYGGCVVEPAAPVSVSIPLALTSFSVIDMTGADVAFTLADGTLTIETASAGLFLLVPAE